MYFTTEGPAKGANVPPPWGEKTLQKGPPSDKLTWLTRPSGKIKSWWLIKKYDKWTQFFFFNHDFKIQIFRSCAVLWKGRLWLADRPPCMRESCVLLILLGWTAAGGTGLCDWPVARYVACTHSVRSASSSVANVTWSPSFTVLKKNLPPSRSAHTRTHTFSVLDKRLRPTAMLYVVGPISVGCFTSGCRYDAMQWIHRKYIPCWDSANYCVPLAAPWHRRENWTTMLRVRGGTIHRCIDISRYFSRDTYRDIIFYNHNFFFFSFCFSTMIFIWAEKRHNNIYMRFLQNNSSNT